MHRLACPFCAVVGLAVSNAAGWMSGWTPGSIATGITMVGGAVVGLRALAIISKSKADSEAWATGERIRMQVEAERERQDSGSLTRKVDALAVLNAKAAADLAEANRVSNERLEQIQRETQQRVEDANKKLHQIQTEAHADILEREAQIRELKAEVVQLKNELREVRKEEARLIGLLLERADGQDQMIANNREAIKETSAAVAEIKKDAEASSGTFPAAVNHPPDEHGPDG